MPASSPALARGFSAQALSTRILFVVVIGFALGVILNGSSTALYRLLEGYSWPPIMRRWGVGRQQAKRERARHGVETAPQGWQRALAQERLSRLPSDETQVAPTALGNALRAVETYGADRFCLDSQTWWTELVAIVPDPLRVELSSARTQVDFFVCLFYVSFALAIVTLATVFHTGANTTRLLWIALAAALLAPAWYRSAVASTTYLQVSVRALVHLGRRDLAARLGFAIPSTIEEERAMWTLIAAFVYYQYNPKWAVRLDPWRAPQASEDWI